MAIAADAFPKMQNFGEKMLKELALEGMLGQCGVICLSVCVCARACMHVCTCVYPCACVGVGVCLLAVLMQ